MSTIFFHKALDKSSFFLLFFITVTINVGRAGAASLDVIQVLLQITLVTPLRASSHWSCLYIYLNAIFRVSEKTRLGAQDCYL